MKIAFIYSEKYKKYEKLINCIISDLEIEYKNIQNIFDINISKFTRRKYDLYIVFSDDAEDFEIDRTIVKGKSMLITSNLKSEYINYVIAKVTDIVYSKNKIRTIINRIIGNLNRSDE